MKKLSLLLLAALVFSAGFSQQKGKSREKIEATIEADFAKVLSTTKAADLVPFYSNGKWGYLDRNTMKVVLPARYNELCFFYPDMYYYSSYNGVRFKVNRHGRVELEKPYSEMDYGDMQVAAPDDYMYGGIRIVSSKDGFKGFTVDKDGKLKSYSDIYTASNSPYWNITPFKYKNGYLAVASLKGGGKGIIDSLGNAQPGFNFNYETILYNEYAKDKDRAWFFVQDSTNMWSLKSIDGQLMFKDELPQWPLTSEQCMGFNHYDDRDGKHSLFDYHELKWIVEPQAKYEIKHIRYSSEEELEYDNPLGRSKAHIYYLVVDGKSQYYVDMDGRKYVPKTK